MSFGNANAGILILLALAVVYAGLRRRGRRPALWFNLRAQACLRKSWRVRSRMLLPLLYCLAVGLLIVCCAQPRAGLTQRRIDSEGLAIQLVLDRSGSMEQDDYRLDGKWVTRLQAVQQVAARFVTGSDRFTGRTHDAIGLVTFAGRAVSTSPLTLDHVFLVHRLEEVRPAQTFREDGTAIGDALGLAVAKLQKLDEQHSTKQPEETLSKVVILLTDGEQNAGKLEILEAADLAALFDVRVHAVSIGERRADSTAPSRSSDAESQLRRVAERTGGQLFHVASTADLENVYAQIDQMEKTRLDRRVYADYRELAVEWFSMAGVPFSCPPLAALALMLFAVRLLLECTVFRSIP